MHKRLLKIMVVMLVVSLLAGAVPAMAAEEENGLSLFEDMGEGVNGLGAVDENTEPAGDLIALDDLNISVRASDYIAVRQDEDEFVYIYTMDDGAIPYVMIGKYDIISDDFIDDFTEYMASSYPDLQVAQDATPLTLGGGKEFTLVVYSYTISGYDAIDIRLFREFNGDTYMFATKAVTELGKVVPNGYIEQVAGSMEILSGGYGDYPLHVDSTHDIEPSLDGLVLPVEDDPAGGIDADTSPVGSADEPVGGVGNTPDESVYDGVVTFDPSMAGYAGTWVEFEDGFKLYVPSDWLQYELTDEDREDRILFYAFDASDPDARATVLVNWTMDTTVHSVDDLSLALDQMDGGEAEDILLINGIPCATYAAEGGALSGLMFFHPLQGEPRVFNIMVYDYIENEDIMNSILCSLSLAG